MKNLKWLNGIKDDLKDFIKELKTVTKRGYGDKRIDEIRKSRFKALEKILNR